MLQKCNEKIWEAMTRLQGSKDFEVVLSWLRDSLSEADRHSVGLDGNNVYRDQGERRTVRQILDEVAFSREYLEKVNQGKQSKGFSPF